MPAASFAAGIASTPFDIYWVSWSISFPARGNLLRLSTRKTIVAEHGGLSEIVLRMEDKPLRVAHFVQRYPPALGGSEAYFARLGRHLADAGDAVTVFTTAAIDLEAFWLKQGRCLPAGTDTQNGVVVRRYPISRWAGRRYLLKSLSFIPNRLWQCLTLPCNPIALRMWRDCGKRDESFD